MRVRVASRTVEINKARGIELKIIKAREGMRFRIDGFQGPGYIKPSQMVEISEALHGELQKLGATSKSLVPPSVIAELHALRKLLATQRIKAKANARQYRADVEARKEKRKHNYKDNPAPTRRAVIDYQKNNRAAVNARHVARFKQRKAIRDSAILFLQEEMKAGVPLGCNMPMDQLSKQVWR